MYIDNQILSKLAHAGIEPQMLGLTTFGQTAMRSTEKLLSLNAASMRANWERSVNATRELMACSAPQERLSVMAKRTREDMEAGLSYGRELTSIALVAQREWLSEIEARNASARNQMASVIDQWASNAPAGAETGATLLKAAFQTMNASYEQWKEAIRQSQNALTPQASAGKQPADKTAGAHNGAKEQAARQA